MRGRRMHTPVEIMNQVAGQSGNTIQVVLFFLFGFSCLVISVFMWLKQEDNSFEKASNQIKDLRTDIVLEIGKIGTRVELTEKVQRETWDLLQDHLSKSAEMDLKIDQRLDANELEIKRLREWRDVHVSSHAKAAHHHHHTVQEILIKQDKPWEFILKRAPKGAKVGKTEKAKSGSGLSSVGTGKAKVSEGPPAR